MKALITRQILVKIAVIMAVCAVFSSSARSRTEKAEEVEGIFNKANEAYWKGEYRKAAGLYRSLVDLGVRSAGVYYNQPSIMRPLPRRPSLIDKAHLTGEQRKEVLARLDAAYEVGARFNDPIELSALVGAMPMIRGVPHNPTFDVKQVEFLIDNFEC